MASSQDQRAPPLDLSHHLSRTTRARQASSIKLFYKYFALPGIGQLAGGLPNDLYFPFDTLEAKIARPDRFDPTPNRPVDPPAAEEALAALSLYHSTKTSSSSRSQPPQDSLTVPHTSSEANPIKKIDLKTALQYGTAQGYPPLYYFIRQFTRDHMHPNCPYRDGPEVILTCGNTDGLSKCLQAFNNEWSEEKDWVRDREGLLVEEFAYMNAVQAAKPRGMNIVPVGIDDEGMRVEGKGGLREVLETWDHKKGKRPHLMYTVTMGQNPTSGVLSLQRRREIYALCSQFDIIILEDDPYWYLQFPSATAANTITTSSPLNTSFHPSVPMFANAEPRPSSWKSSGFDFLDSLVPSYVSVDTEGRVVRLDTFSKTVAPGCRLGWITAQPALIERILRVTETSTQQPSGFVQSIVAELVLGPDHKGLENMSKSKSKILPGEGWKGAGWVRWLEGLRGNYERRMNVICSIMDQGKYLVKSGRRNSLSQLQDEEAEEEDEWSVIEKTQLYSFDWPVGGMFIWWKLHFESHPLFHAYRHTPGIFGQAFWVWLTRKPYRVLVAPGTMFSPTEEIKNEQGWRFFRICFAAIEEGELKGTAERLVEAVGGFWKIKQRKVIEELVGELEEQDILAEGCGLQDLRKMVGPC